MREIVKLSASFKLDGEISEIFNLYKKIVNEFLNYASTKNITSFKRLKKEKYYELRKNILSYLPIIFILPVKWLAQSTSLLGSLKGEVKLKEINLCLRETLLCLTTICSPLT